MKRALALLVGTAFITAAACSDPDVAGTPLDGVGFDSGTPTAGDDASGGAQCTPAPETPMDPSTLPSCCTDGAAHCVPSDKVPGAVQSHLAMCTGGYCVPDPYIKTGKVDKPPHCQSLGMADGVCLSVCIPQVAQYKTLLPQATCAEGERCAPCISPLDKMSTGACDIGAGGGGVCAPGPDGGANPTSDGGANAACPHTGAPVIDPIAAMLPSCYAGGGAHCLDKSLVPPAMVSRLAACPTGLCVPDDFIEAGGNFIPKTCASIGGGEGRCLHVSLPEVAAQAAQLPQATCAAYEKCVPCTNPIDGTDTGSCHLSCDPGLARPKFVFANCCDQGGQTYGKCVPASMVPSSEASELVTDTCSGSDLCAPTENLLPTFHPQACTAFALVYFGNYSGVCLSTCLQFSGIQGLVIKQGDCDGVHQCVPCAQPGGAPTGAPGCP